MNIIEMSGGLGNQMFQYALYLSFIAKGIDVKLDTSFYKDKNQTLRKLEISKFTNVIIKEATRIEVIKNKGFSNRVLKSLYFGNNYVENLDKGYQPEIFDLENAYISGYWQCEKYFKDIRSYILNAFDFEVAMRNASIFELCEKIKTMNAVSLHIRRSDYLNEANYKIYGDICTKQYYENAISYIRKRIKEPHFFVFSDDIEWCKKNSLLNEKMTFVDSSGWDNVTDMYLMTLCKYHIIANSSFSWWGAWLGVNEDKLVIAPEKWFNNHEHTDMICEDWVRLGS